MNDDELIHAAARAVGIVKWRWLDGRFQKWGIADYARNLAGWEYWEPLLDDGAALRLAVTLKIQITIDSMYVFGSNDPAGDSGFCECLSGDAQTATRRAIVRAAAARTALTPNV